MLKNKTKLTNPLRTFSLCVVLLLHTGIIAQQNAKVSLNLYENPIKKTIALIEKSENNIQAVVYKFEVHKMLDALIKAHERGIKIQLIVDAKEAKKKKSLVKLAKENGIKIRKWKQGKMHAKFIIIDEKAVISGSFNWTKSAKKENLELIVFYDDKTTVDGFVFLFKNMWEIAYRKEK